MADMMAKEPSRRIAMAREVRARLAPFVKAEAADDAATAAPTLPLRPLRPAVPPPPIVARLPGDEQESSQEMLIPVRSRLTVYWPLALFVLTPLALAGAVLLLWWLAKMLF